MGELKGKDIQHVYTYYEHLMVRTEDGSFFIDLKSLQELLSKHTFTTEKKKTRTWIKVKE